MLQVIYAMPWGRQQQRLKYDDQAEYKSELFCERPMEIYRSHYALLVTSVT